LQAIHVAPAFNLPDHPEGVPRGNAINTLFAPTSLRDECRQDAGSSYRIRPLDHSGVGTSLYAADEQVPMNPIAHGREVRTLLIDIAPSVAPVDIEEGLLLPILVKHLKGSPLRRWLLRRSTTDGILLLWVMRTRVMPQRDTISIEAIDEGLSLNAPQQPETIEWSEAKGARRLRLILR